MKFKVIFLTIVSFFILIRSYSQQDTININGSGTNYATPWGGSCPYSFQQQLFKQSQIGRSGEISIISYMRSTGTLMRNITIYMTHTSKTSIESVADIIPTDSMTLVFQGMTVPTPLSNWNRIILTNPFVYNGMDNLMIGIIDNTGINGGPTHSSNNIYNKQLLMLVSSTQPINPNNPVYSGISISNIFMKSQLIFLPDTNLCLTPNISLNNLTHSGCELKWDSSSCCQLWEFKIRRFNTPNWLSMGVIDTNSIVLDTLNMNTKYEILCRNIYNNNNTSNWKLFTFTTLCGPCTQLPLNENLDNIIRSQNNNVYPPNCWKILNMYDNYHHVVDNLCHSIPNSFEIYSNEYLISPYIQENLSTLGIRLRYFFYNNSSSIQIGTIADTNNSNTFTPLDTIFYTTGGNLFKDYYLSLSAAQTSHHRIAIKNSGSSSFHIDDIVINHISNCDAVIYPQVDTITAHTCQISWQDLNAASEWQITYSTKPFNPDTASLIINSTTNFKTLTNLIRDTTYYIFIRSKCDSIHYSNWSDTIKCRTLFSDCSNPTQFQLVPNSLTAHSAQISWIPTGSESVWEVCYSHYYISNPNLNGTKILVQNPTYTFTNLPNQYNLYVYVRAVCDSVEKSEWLGMINFQTLYSDCPTPTNVIAISDSITSTSAFIKWNKISDVNHYQIIYDSTSSFSPNYSNNGITVLSSDTSKWITGLKKNKRYSLYVRAICNTDTISNWSSRLNFNTLFSDCKKPLNINTQIIEDSVYISWTKNGNDCLSYEIQYGERPFETYFNQINTTDTFLTVFKNPNISHWYIKVRTLCLSDTSDWIKDSMIICPIKSRLPFYEDFYVPEYYAYNQHCWGYNFIVNNNSISISPATANVTPFNGLGMLLWNSYNYMNGSSTRYITAPISTKNYTDINYRFAWYVSNSYPTKDDGFTIQYSFDGWNWINASSFIDRRSSTHNLSNNQWIFIQDSLPSAIWNKDSIYIGFLFKSAYGDNCYLDNFVIDGTEHECNPPSEIFSDFFGSSVLIYWNNDGESNSLWELKYKKTLESEYHYIQLTDTFVMLTNLEPNTNYDIRIKKYCSNDYESSFSKRYTFNSSGQSNIDFQDFILNEISINPNPSLDFFEIHSINQLINSVDLYNISGSLLNTYNSDQLSFILNLKDKPKGFYLIKIKLDNGDIITKKIIKI